MITFTPLKTGFKATDGKTTLAVFPETADKSAITLLGVPQEEPEDGVISWPGEYNMKGITLRGLAHKDGQQASFIVIMDEIHLAFLSAPLQDWTDEQIEAAGNIDVMVLPMQDVRIIQKLVDEIDPRILILIPTDDGDAYSAVFKAVGAKDESVMKEYKVKSLPQEGREVVVLQK